MTLADERAVIEEELRKGIIPSTVASSPTSGIVIPSEEGISEIGEAAIHQSSSEDILAAETGLLTDHQSTISMESTSTKEGEGIMVSDKSDREEGKEEVKEEGSDADQVAAQERMIRAALVELNTSEATLLAAVHHHTTTSATPATSITPSPPSTPSIGWKAVREILFGGVPPALPAALSLSPAQFLSLQALLNLSLSSFQLSVESPPSAQSTPLTALPTDTSADGTTANDAASPSIPPPGSIPETEQASLLSLSGNDTLSHRDVENPSPRPDVSSPEGTTSGISSSIHEASNEEVVGASQSTDLDVDNQTSHVDKAAGVGDDSIGGNPSVNLVVNDGDTASGEELITRSGPEEVLSSASEMVREGDNVAPGAVVEESSMQSDGSSISPQDVSTSDATMDIMGIPADEGMSSPTSFPAPAIEAAAAAASASPSHVASNSGSGSASGSVGGGGTSSGAVGGQ